ncbi:MAG TPA: hypothetical protein VFU02_12835 [Polyangiaceae bacterium]|nr:hypothetical protein [Polyangiaceae bacterium]
MLNESAGGTPSTRVGVPNVGVPLMPLGQVQPAFPPPEPPLPPPPPPPPVVELVPPAPLVLTLALVLALVPATVLLPVVADVDVAVVVATLLVVAVSVGPPLVLLAVLVVWLVLVAVLLVGLPAVLAALSLDEESSDPQATDVASAPRASRCAARCFVHPRSGAATIFIGGSSGVADEHTHQPGHQTHRFRRMF